MACGRDAVILTVERWYDFPEFGGYLGNVGYKQKYTSIDWRGVASIGNILRHAYEQVIDEEIWLAVTTDLGPLKTVVTAIFEDIGQGSTE